MLQHGGIPSPRRDLATWGRASVPLPEAILSPLYRMRRRLRGAQFSYGMNRRRFHYAAVPDGTRAADLLGYTPEIGIDWPTDKQEGVE